MRVLVVEDDPDLSVLVELWLAAGATDLVTRLRGSDDEVTDDDLAWADAALVDYHLPGVDGRQLCRRIWETRPTVRRVLWSAYPPPEPCEWVDQTLTKPATLEQVQAALNGR